MRNFLYGTLILTQTIFAQLNPISYNLGYSLKNSEISDVTPTSNSIQDIIATDNLILLGTLQGLSLSEDNGENWNNFYETEPFGTDGTTAIGYNNEIIWCATGRITEIEGGSILPEGTGIKYSTDNGDTWIAIPQPVDNPDDSLIIYGINRIRALPITAGIQNISYDISFTKNTIWIASFAGGLRKSSDMGETWERVLLPPDILDSIKPTDTLSFSLQPVAGAFGDESWLNHRVFSVLGVDDSTLYVGTAGGINKSTDNGISWTKFSHTNQTNPISGNFVVGLGKNKTDNSIWAATWKAEDQSEFWAVSNSADGGENWATTLPGEHAHNFGFKYLSDGSSQVFAPTDKGIFRSKDNGANWIRPDEIKDNNTNTSIVTDIFYSAASNQVNTTDYNIWVGSNDGLARLSETNGFWEGDWKVYKEPTNIKEEASVFPNEFNLAQNYPNPFNPSTTIQFTLPKTGMVSLKVYNILGEEVAELINREMNAGFRSINFDASHLSSGLYFYRISTSDFMDLKKMILLK